jgi:gliding motility-associated-like protein
MQQGRYKKIITLSAGMMLGLLWIADLSAQMPTNGLIAYYPFNNNANDVSGNGNDASGLFNPTFDRCGVLNWAHKSGGTNYLHLAPDNFINLNEYSYSLWFRADSVPSVNSCVLFAVGSPSQGYEQSFAFSPNVTLVGSGSNIGNNPSLSIIQTTPVQTGRWIHGVLVRDNTKLRIFINGTLAAYLPSSDSLTNGQSANYGSDPQATIGCHYDSSGYGYDVFIGSIDEVRIYNRALNEEEIKQLYYTECTLTEIIGPTEVCQGQQNVTYHVDPLISGSLYEWTYLGAPIQDSDNYITVNFADSTTSGTLTVTVTGDFIDAQTRSLKINVVKLPSEAGTINGKDLVCQGDTGVIYEVPAIDNASSYTWVYSGTGAMWTGNSNVLSVDFSSDATGGNFTVAGKNACGSGSASPPFPVVIGQLPSSPGVISGESEVCAGQKEIPYSIPAIQNATDYIWNYSGSGVILTKNSNAVAIDFDSTATSGELTVTGMNSCGSSVSPAVFPISVLYTPAEAGMISGDTSVCLGQNAVPYSVPSIQYATGYLWEYSGTGAVITGNANTIAIDFSGEATGGNLTIAGKNTCGEGKPSPDFSITVNDCSVSPVEISIPNAFSPNGDGVNDVFRIRGLPENSTLIIFDRAGHTLFTSSSYANDWDGKDRAGNMLNSGTYWYVLSVPGVSEEYKGFIYLKR